MKKHKKMLIAFKDPELNCFTNKGDWLYIARKKERSLRLHKKFFTGFSEEEKKEIFES